MDKNELRKKYKEIRKALPLDKISSEIIENLFTFDKFLKAKRIFTYISTPFEVNTSAILNIKEKEIFVPKITGREMIMTKYSADNLVKNVYGIKEPKDAIETEPDENDVIIVPALSVDINGNRLGYGGGYYDSYLGKNDKAKKIVLIPKALICEIIPAEEYDIKVDYIISEKEIIKC